MSGLLCIRAIFILPSIACGASVTNTSQRVLVTPCLYSSPSIEHKPCSGSPWGRRTPSTKVEPRKDTLVPGVRYSSGVTQVYSKEESASSGAFCEGSGDAAVSGAGESSTVSDTTGWGLAAVDASPSGPLLYQSSKSSWLMIGLPNSRAF